MMLEKIKQIGKCDLCGEEEEKACLHELKSTGELCCRECLTIFICDGCNKPVCIDEMNTLADVRYCQDCFQDYASGLENCSICKELFPITELCFQKNDFYSDSIHFYGENALCEDCAKKINKKNEADYDSTL